MSQRIALSSSEREATMTDSTNFQKSDQEQELEDAEESKKLEQRIIELLTSTRLTFKQIVNKLQVERKSVSISLIRRINREHQFRRPRYDSKLTREQRESLLDELMRQCAGGTMRPNLSQLAKKFGVCHGSIWYWWDKLNKLTIGQSRLPNGSKRISQNEQHLRYQVNTYQSHKQEQQYHDSSASIEIASSSSKKSSLSLIGDLHNHFKSYKLLGRVEITLKQPSNRSLPSLSRETITLPIMMLTRLNEVD